MRWHFHSLFLLLASLLLVTPAAIAEEGAVQQAEPKVIAVAPGPSDPFGRGVPREALRGFLQACRDSDFERASEYLDLRRYSASDKKSLGPELARKLKVILDQTLWVELETLSIDPNGHANDGLPAYRDRVGQIQSSQGLIDVLIQRVPRANDNVEIWKISSATLNQIDKLYAEFGPGPLEEMLPPIFFRSRLLEIELWQWLGLLALVLLVYLAAWLAASLLVRVARPLVARSETDFDDKLLELAIGPLRLGIFCALFASGLGLLSLALPAERFFSNVQKVLTIVAVTWFVLRMIDMFAGYLVRRLDRRGNHPATHIVPLGRKTLKVVIASLAFLASLDSFGFDITALIAGLGVGGIAVALAAQKTIENLFGGITLLADQPVRVGDFCRFGDRVGVVEGIGLRSTRIRTLDRTLVTVSNSEFSSLQLENFAKRDRILFNPTLGLRYETTAEQLRFVLVEIRRMFYAHPKVSPEPARVRFTSYGDFSLNLAVFTYINVINYDEYLAIVEDLNLRIMDIVEKSGTGFAFPSQTLYLGKDELPSDETAKTVADQVAVWRDQGELYLPNFSQQEIQKLHASLEYPQAGSPDAKKTG